MFTYSASDFDEKIICIDTVFPLQPILAALPSQGVNEEDYKSTLENDTSINGQYDNESDEIPPERDLREPQPTISVNYRFIKDIGPNEIKDKNHKSKNKQYQDDWNNNDSEW